MKKLMKMSTAITVDIAYENHVQYMWEIRGKAENFMESPLLKTLWNTCGNAADKPCNNRRKAAIALSRHYRITFCKHEYLRSM
jgi:hypothetical protein